MNLTNNILAAFMAGVSTVQEDKLVMKEMAEDQNFSDLLDVLDDVDAMDAMDEMRKEFNEFDDDVNEIKEYNINIK